MAYDQAALSSYVRFYVTVVTQLEAVWSAIERSQGAMREALGPSAEALRSLDHPALTAALGPAVTTPPALGTLWRPADPEHEHAGGHRVERAGVPDLAGGEHAAYPGDDVVRRHPRGLVDHNQMLVLIGDDEIHVLRHIMRGSGGGQAQFELRRCGCLGGGIPQDAPAGIGNAAALDQRLDALARQAGQSLGQRAVEPQPGRAVAQRHGQNVVVPLHWSSCGPVRAIFKGMALALKGAAALGAAVPETAELGEPLHP